ncbi:MAG: M48 family metalloprotease [Saprospiraceae bacterium]|nr:M48 family metalloprotease [Saprospiraceae bacterium]
MNDAFYISDAVLRALGWTLVHSLWQGALGALILLMVLPRLRSAMQRYWVAYGALLALFAGACLTCAAVYVPGGPALISEGGISEMLPGSIADAVAYQITGVNLWQQMTGWLEGHYPLIVALWLAGFVFFMLRLLGGLWNVRQLLRHGVYEVPEAWREKADGMSRKLGIRRAVTLMESALVHTPMALGWLKPFVLFPVGMINRLGPDEVEAVLAHEMAHIARRDWIYNLLQAFIETLFYYHPAVWWISMVVRRERENSCDDAALAATGNRIAYAKALVQVQEMAKPAPVPALALGMGGSRRFLLLERIRRILNQPQQKSQVMEKFIATAILLVLLVLVGLRANHNSTLGEAFAQITEMPRTLLGINDDDLAMEADSLKPNRNRRIIREDGDERVEAEYHDGELVRLNINGEEVPESEFENHAELVDELLRDIPAPPAPPTPPVAPIPPVPPMPPHAPNISKIRDDEGNTIIRIDRNGQPTEIIVKDGEVWVGNQKLEEGEPVEVPELAGGYYFFPGNEGEDHFYFAPNDFHFEGIDPAEFQFRFSDEDRVNWEKDIARYQEDIARMKDEMQEMNETRRAEQLERIRGQEKALHEEMREMERQQRNALRDVRKQQREMARDMRRAQDEVIRQQQEAERQMQRAKRLHESSFGARMKAELKRDGLIEDPLNYSLELTSGKMTVNGKKQSKELHRKYLQLYREMTGKEMGKKDSFSVSERN